MAVLIAAAISGCKPQAEEAEKADPEPVLVQAVEQDPDNPDPFEHLQDTPAGPWDLKSGDYRLHVALRQGDREMDKGMYWGFYCQYVVSEFRVWYKGGETVPFRTLFADLGMVNEVSLESKGRRAFIRLGGSDGGEAFHVTYKYLDGWPVWRIVYSITAPGRTFTTFSFEPLE